MPFVPTFSGCYRFGAKLTSSGYKTRTENTLHDCNQLCNDNVGCHLFQWNEINNECKLFDQVILNENEIFSKEVNSVIGVPDCNDEKVIWLKRPFEIPTTTTTTTNTTTSPTAETANPRNEEKKPSKYIFSRFKDYLIMSKKFIKIFLRKSPFSVNST